MPIAYSKDLRTRVISAWKAKEGSQRQRRRTLSGKFELCATVLRRYRQTGQVESKPRGATVAPKITDTQLAALLKLVNQRPDALLEELCEGWAQQSGTKVSVPTMHRALERLGSRRKKNAIRL